jgi:hypothetical protein
MRHLPKEKPEAGQDTRPLVLSELFEGETGERWRGRQIMNERRSFLLL